MAVGVPDDGLGATLTLGTSTWDTAAVITSITPDAITREALDTTHLGTTTAKTFIPSDLRDNGGFSIEFIADAATSTTNIVPPMAAAETVTITYPPPSGSTNGATIAGSAFCTEYTPLSAAPGELMKGSAKWKWASTITFTAAS